jgi:hypothetical protein
MPSRPRAASLVVLLACRPLCPKSYSHAPRSCATKPRTLTSSCLVILSSFRIRPRISHTALIRDRLPFTYSLFFSFLTSRIPALIHTARGRARPPPVSRTYPFEVTSRTQPACGFPSLLLSVVCRLVCPLARSCRLSYYYPRSSLHYRSFELVHRSSHTRLSPLYHADVTASNRIFCGRPPSLCILPSNSYVIILARALAALRSLAIWYLSSLDIDMVPFVRFRGRARVQRARILSPRPRALVFRVPMPSLQLHPLEVAPVTAVSRDP